MIYKFEPRLLPVFGEWRYRRLPDGGLVQSAPTVCPNGHQLGPNRCRLIWDPALRETVLCCDTCHDTNPKSAIFRASEPDWMTRFRELVRAGQKVEAMKVIDTALPAPPKPDRRRDARTRLPPPVDWGAGSVSR